MVGRARKRYPTANIYAGKQAAEIRPSRPRNYFHRLRAACFGGTAGLAVEDNRSNGERAQPEHAADRRTRDDAGADVNFRGARLGQADVGRWFILAEADVDVGAAVVPWSGRK
jgi:hypothetical protein